MGTGFDPLKATLYMPTKVDEGFSRGVYGEGLKVNQAMIMRQPGVTLRTHSLFKKSDGSHVLWARTPYRDNNMMMHRGFDAPLESAAHTGTVTTVRFPRVTKESAAMLAVFDPRRTPLESIASEYGAKTHIYPLGINEKGQLYPGVSLSNGTQQYLQGLRIGDGKKNLLFSYDFPSKDILAGRDRNFINIQLVHELVKDFWTNVDSVPLLIELTRRSLLQEGARDAAERDVFCRRIVDTHREWERPILQRWAEALPTTLGLVKDKPNYIAGTKDTKRYLVSDKANVVELVAEIPEWSQENLALIIRKHCKDYVMILPSEIHEAPRAPTQTRETQEKLSPAEEVFVEKMKRLGNEVREEIALSPGVHDVFPRFGKPIITFSRAQFSSQKIYLKFGNTRAGTPTIEFTVPGDGTNPDDLFDPEKDVSTRERMKNRVLIAFLAHCSARHMYLRETDEDWTKAAQDTAQGMLDSISRDTDVRHISPTLHKRVQNAMLEQGLGRLASKEKDERAQETQKLIRQALRHDIDPEDLYKIILYAEENLEQAPGYWYLVEVCRNRTIRQGSICSYIENDGGIDVLKQVDISNYPKSHWHGYEVCQLPNKRLIVSVPTFPHSLLSMRTLNEKGQEFVVQHAVLADALVFMSNSEVTNNTRVWHGRRYPHLDTGCIVVESLDQLKDFSYQPVTTTRDKDDKRIPVGTLVSPVTLEYINPTWSEPRRIFQDIAQNHLDASPEGVRERFLIQRDGNEVWISAENLGDDRIIGYEMSDTGLGFSPDGIQNMGHTRKRNPFLTGKNGEGLKLAAASALKHGFEIEYASTGEIDDMPAAWVGKGVYISQPYEHEGERRSASRLGFEITAHGLDTLESATSRTRVRLPKDATQDVWKQWSSWTNVIDPRKKDSFGNTGINRYLIRNESTQGKSVTAGPVTALLERPGHIFENGMFVRSEPQSHRRFKLGWDFPAITKTRERSHIDEKLAQQYIRYFFENTDNEQAVELLLRNVVERYDTAREVLGTFLVGQNELEGNRMQTDLSPDFVFGTEYRYSSMPSLPLLRKVAARLYPGKVLFSYEYASRRGHSLQGAIQHIPRQLRLNVSEDNYKALQDIFPTMQDYWSGIRENIVVTGEEERNEMRNQVDEQARAIVRSMTSLRDDAATRSMFSELLKRAGISGKKFFANLDALAADNTRGTASDVFFGGDDSRWHGLASAGIGIHVELLARPEWRRLASVIDHEIAHKMSGLTDYKREFITFLYLTAREKARARGEKKA